MNRVVAILDTAVNLQTLCDKYLSEQDIKSFMALLSSDTVNVPLKDGKTMVHYAVCLPNEANRATALERTLELGGCPNGTCAQTPLHIAIQVGNAVAVSVLIKHPKIDLSQCDIHGRSALRIACETMVEATVYSEDTIKAQTAVNIVKLLLEKVGEATIGEGLSVAFFVHMTGNQYASTMLQDLELSQKIGHIRIGDVLRFCNPLLFSAYRKEIGNIACFDRIVAYRRFEDGATALHCVVLSPNTVGESMMQALLQVCSAPELDNPAEQLKLLVDETDDSGYSAIHYAAETNATWAIRRLISWGANIQQSNTAPWPIQVAIECGSEAAFQTLLEPSQGAGLSRERLLEIVQTAWKNAMDKFLELAELKETKVTIDSGNLLPLHLAKPKQPDNKESLTEVVVRLGNIRKIHTTVKGLR